LLLARPRFRDYDLVTMSAKVKRIAAGEFKAKCLRLLDEVAERGEHIIVTKRGKPVAKLVPVVDKDVHDLRGSVLWYGDIVSPIDVEWEANT
jgi:prevent-host-death family protein